MVDFFHLAILFLSLSINFLCDLFLYWFIGILAAMTFPVTYMKNEDKIKRIMEWAREKYKICYEIIDEKAINKIKSRIVNYQEKDKKIE